MEKLSVCVTAYDHHDLTVIHVRESMNANRTPDEIIVVNDGGEESLREKLLALPRICPIIYARILEDIPWNYNGACNLAVWLSTGDYLAFEDNDNIPLRDFYDQALALFKANPALGRICAKKRKVIKDISLPFEQWEVVNSIGPNMGTAMIPREVYLRVKGMDERFAGEYGYMYYEWKHRLMHVAKVGFEAVGEYYYSPDGQSDLKRSNSWRNLRLLRENGEKGCLQPPGGILNFHYQYETFGRR